MFLRSRFTIGVLLLLASSPTAALAQEIYTKGGSTLALEGIDAVSYFVSGKTRAWTGQPGHQIQGRDLAIFQWPRTSRPLRQIRKNTCPNMEDIAPGEPHEVTPCAAIRKSGASSAESCI